MGEVRKLSLMRWKRFARHIWGGETWVLAAALVKFPGQHNGGNLHAKSYKAKEKEVNLKKLHLLVNASFYYMHAFPFIFFTGFRFLGSSFRVSIII